MGKSGHSLIKSLLRLVTIVPLFFNVANKFLSLVETEVYLAKRKILLMAVVGIVFFALIASTWLCFSAMLFVYLVSLNLSYVMSLFFVFLLNLFLLVITGFLMINMQNEGFFPKTRELMIHNKE